MTCPTCSLPTDRWPFCLPAHCMFPKGQDAVYRSIPAAAHEKERCVVWRHPETGEIRYPGANDFPMNDNYRQRGFERHELPTLRSIEQFEKEHKVLNEKAWFDDGSGRGHE